MRGYQKKVIYLKNVGSPFFEEAYFVLRAQDNNDEKGRISLIEEANRIVEENIKTQNLKKKRFWKSDVFAFFIGFISAALTMILITLIF